MELWKASLARDPSLAVVHRNLAIAASHQPGARNLDEAIRHLEAAVALPGPSSIFFSELDELDEAAGVAPEKRLAVLDANHETVARRDDALGREIALRVLLGQCDRAIALLTGRTFAVWEGGTLTAAGDWTEAHLRRGVERMSSRRFEEALADFQAAGQLPENLPTETHDGTARQEEIAYRIGIAEEALGRHEEASAAWGRAAQEGASSPEGRPRRGFPGNTAEAYFRALALRRLGRTDAAEEVLRALAGSAGPAATVPAPGDLDRNLPVPTLRRECAWRRGHTCCPALAAWAWGRPSPPARNWPKPCASTRRTGQHARHWPSWATGRPHPSSALGSVKWQRAVQQLQERGVFHGLHQVMMKARGLG